MEQKEFNKIYDEIVNDEFIIMNKPWQDAKDENYLLKYVIISVIILLNFLLLSFLISIAEFGKDNKIIFTIVTLMGQQVILVPIYLFLSFIYTRLAKYEEKNKFIKLFKEKIIIRLINNFFNNAEYLHNPDQTNLKKIYEEAEFNKGSSSNDFEDYIKAQINSKYNVEMVEFRIGTDYLHGIFAKIEMEKSINSKVEIYRNSTFA